MKNVPWERLSDGVPAITLYDRESPADEHLTQAIGAWMRRADKVGLAIVFIALYKLKGD